MAETETKSKETVDGRREFLAPNGANKYYIAMPTSDDIRGADWQYSKIYTKSLVEGITTAAEMNDILLRRGVVGPEFDQRQKELTDELAKKVAKLQATDDLEEKQLLAVDVANAREELFNWNQRLNGPMANTCEQMADDARLEYLTANIVENKDGSKVWSDINSFLNEKNQALAMRARFEVMLYLQGLDSDFLEKTPEALAMKEVEEDMQKKTAEVLAELEEEQKEKEAKEAADAKSKATKKTKSSKTKGKGNKKSTTKKTSKK